MHKLTATLLQQLGAPARGGAQQIEEWLRALLRGGLVRLPGGPVELRGSEPVVTTLGDLKKACGVAVETVKQGLRSLELDHWVLLVDGAHTRLLGPPRFRISVTKENLWGSVGQAMELAVMDGLNPLESIDHDELRRRESIVSRKAALTVDRVTLEWTAQVRLTNGQHLSPQPNDAFTLASGTQVQREGRVAMLREDSHVVFVGGRDVRTAETAELLPEQGEGYRVPARTLLHLDRSSIVRLAGGQTGLLQVASPASLDGGETVDWNTDSHWLSRFHKDSPLVLLRRAIYAELAGIVNESCAGVGPTPANPWRVVLGVHDCFLDGLIPFHARRCRRAQSPAVLIEFLRSLPDTASLREQIGREFGFTVAAADVRITPAMFASAYDRKLLRRIGTAPEWNSELLSLANKVPCWSQVGAYCRKDAPWPWEVTREIYFTYVDVRYRQHGAE